ncbi:MAG: hypothetical protein AB7J28_01425 [Hyphomonadaceae bacterium]
MAAFLNAARAFAFVCLLAAPAAAQERDAIELTALSPQPLEPGRCGLFLWSRSEQPAFVFVAYDQPAEARVRAGERSLSLPRTDFSGERQSGHFEHQTFSDGRLTLAVDLRFDPERQIRSGTVVESGVIRVRNREGWETVVPVGGMVACQARA